MDSLDDGGRDLSASIALALERYAAATGVVVLAADLPHVTAGDVRELVAHARPLALVAAADGTTNAIAEDEPVGAAEFGHTPIASRVSPATPQPCSGWMRPVSV